MSEGNKMTQAVYCDIRKFGQKMYFFATFCATSQPPIVGKFSYKRSVGLYLLVVFKCPKQTFSQTNNVAQTVYLKKITQDPSCFKMVTSTFIFETFLYEHIICAYYQYNC